MLLASKLSETAEAYPQKLLMEIEMYDDTHCMSFVSIVKKVFLLCIVSILVVYAFSQNTNRNAKNQRRTFRTPSRTPLRTPRTDRMPTNMSDMSMTNIPSVAPVYTDSTVPREEGVSDTSDDMRENFNSNMYFRTPDPSISPYFFKKDTVSTESLPSKNFMPQESKPEITPSYSVQAPMVKIPPPYTASVPMTKTYREVAPDSRKIDDRTKVEEIALIEVKEEDTKPIESFPSSIPIPKTAHTPNEEKNEEKMPKSIEDVMSPNYNIEQKPEYTPFADPLLLTKKKEDEPEVPPNKSVTIPVVPEQPVKKETSTVQSSWSIAATEDKYPLREKKLQEDELREEATLESENFEAVSAPLPKKQTVDVKTALADGTFIQLASYSKKDDAKHAATSPKLITKRNNIFVYKKLSSQYYKLVVGPFKKDDVGVQLLSYNRKGFSDAFVLKQY